MLFLNRVRPEKPSQRVEDMVNSSLRTRFMIGGVFKRRRELLGHTPFVWISEIEQLKMDFLGCRLMKYSLESVLKEVVPRLVQAVSEEVETSEDLQGALKALEYEQDREKGIKYAISKVCGVCDPNLESMTTQDDVAQDSMKNIAERLFESVDAGLLLFQVYNLLSGELGHFEMGMFGMHFEEAVGSIYLHLTENADAAQKYGLTIAMMTCGNRKLTLNQIFMDKTQYCDLIRRTFTREEALAKLNKSNETRKGFAYNYERVRDMILVAFIQLCSVIDLKQHVDMLNGYRCINKLYANVALKLSDLVYERGEASVSKIYG